MGRHDARALSATLLATTCLAFAMPDAARANPEPNAYDTRSVGLGLTGASYLDAPAAVALNPANLEGIARYEFSLLINPLLIYQWAPSHEPGVTERPPVALGPLASIFGAGRIADRVVLGGGIYLSQGYGSTFDNPPTVQGGLDNDPTSPTFGEYLTRPVTPGVRVRDGMTVPDSSVDDLRVIFFNGEASVALSVLAHERVRVGLGLRVPYAQQTVTVYQELLPGTWQWVTQDVRGIGHPSVRVGMTAMPIDGMRLAFAYRPRSRIPLRGVTKLHSTLGAVFFAPDGAIDTESDWFIAHAVTLEGSYEFLDDRLMAVAALRFQFHADANRDQAFRFTEPGAEGFVEGGEIRAYFGWLNIWSARAALEYRHGESWAIRTGLNLAKSASSNDGVQIYTPPPGLNYGVFAGFGYDAPRFRVEFATGVAGGANEVTGDHERCLAGAQVKSGCPGSYGVRTIWISTTLAFRGERETNDD